MLKFSLLPSQFDIFRHISAKPRGQTGAQFSGLIQCLQVIRKGFDLCVIGNFVWIGAGSIVDNNIGVEQARHSASHDLAQLDQHLAFILATEQANKGVRRFCDALHYGFLKLQLPGWNPLCQIRHELVLHVGMA